MSIAGSTTAVPPCAVPFECTVPFDCTVPFEFVRSAAATAGRRGADPAPWLDGLGGGRFPGPDDRGGVAAEQATHLLRVMLGITGDEWFGLAAHPVRPGITKLICLALLGAADLTAWLRDLPAVLLGLRKDAVSLHEQVRRILGDGPAGHWPGPAEVAARLSMSPQNLRRRLREDGLSLTGIKVDLMRDTATTSLLRGGESVAQLSARLGFSEPSAFHRAFRRWTGVSPGAYRAVLRADEASGTASRPARATCPD